MNKDDIHVILQDVFDLPIRDTRRGPNSKILNAILAAMVKAIRRGETVKIVGFGKFELHTRGPRRKNRAFFYGNVPYQQIVMEPAKKWIRFVPSKDIIRTLNQWS